MGPLTAQMPISRVHGMHNIAGSIKPLLTSPKALRDGRRGITKTAVRGGKPNATDGGSSIAADTGAILGALV